MMRRFGLIGFPLTHSFSKKYFTEKFEKENIINARYDLFEIDTIEKFPALWKDNPELIGLNVTIPYKEQVISYLDDLHPAARKIGAVNVIKKEGNKLVGYNSDYFGFKWSLEKFLESNRPKALVLGTGGASKAVKAVLEDMQIDFQVVSRSKATGILTYNEVSKDIVQAHPLLINTTPAGMYPHTEEVPPLPLEYMNSTCYLFDLIYNPPVTKWMQEGMNRGAKAINGLDMLIGQAEKAWEIWNA